MKHPHVVALWRSCVAGLRSRISLPSHNACVGALVLRAPPAALLFRRNTCTPFYGFQPRRYYSSGIAFLWQNETLQNYLQSLMKEHTDLCETLNLTLKEEERKALSQRLTDLSSLCTLLTQIQEEEREVSELDALFADLHSKEDEQLLQEEKDAMNQNINKLREKVVNILVPQNKYDMNDAILEVVSGRTTGGDICQQFTGEVFEMYQNYAHYKGWSFEILNCTPNEYGGVHHAAARIIGEGAYKRLKYEGGIHRVQRIPEVGLSSRMQRIHTGTMSVIVLPQPDEVDIKIDPRDLRIDTFRAKGAGGQHVNTTDSAVRIVHIPSGMSVECQQERSQIQNKEKAMRMLRAKLHEQTVKHELSQRQSSRKLQVGTRDQSDRIRTYNFTQDRLTDHRISYDVRNLRAFLDGEDLLDELIDKVHQLAAAEDLLEVIENYSSRVEQKL